MSPSVTRDFVAHAKALVSRVSSGSLFFLLPSSGRLQLRRPDPRTPGSVGGSSRCTAHSSSHGLASRSPPRASAVLRSLATPLQLFANCTIHDVVLLCASHSRPSLTPSPPDHAAMAGRPSAGLCLLQFSPPAQRWHAVSTSSPCSMYLVARAVCRTRYTRGATTTTRPIHQVMYLVYLPDNPRPCLVEANGAQNMYHRLPVYIALRCAALASPSPSPSPCLHVPSPRLVSPERHCA